MQGHEHYRNAEYWLRESQKPHLDHATTAALAAIGQLHATLALTAATIEAANAASDCGLIHRPWGPDPDLGEVAYPGNGWGRALFGDPTTDNQKEA